MLYVTTRTVRNWEKGRTAVPYSAFKLMRVMTGWELPGGAWDGWCVRGDTLWSPTQRPFQVGTMGYLGLVFAMARQWLRDRGYSAGIPAKPDLREPRSVHGRGAQAPAAGNPERANAGAAGRPGPGDGGLPGQLQLSVTGMDLPDGVLPSVGLSLYDKSDAEGQFHRGNAPYSPQRSRGGETG